MGICPCHSECTEQALSRDTGYHEDTFGLYTDDDVYGILHYGHSCRIFISRFGYRRGVVFGLLLYGVGSLLFIPGQHYLSFNLFLFALFVIGCGLTFLETAANPYATELGAKETAASRLNFAQSFNGLGCICAPVLAGLLLFSKDGQTGSGNVALPYICMGVIVLLVALVFSRIKLPEIEHSVEVDEAGNKVGLWSHRLFISG